MSSLLPEGCLAIFDNIKFNKHGHFYRVNGRSVDFSVTEGINNGPIPFSALPLSVRTNIQRGTVLHERLGLCFANRKIDKSVKQFKGMEKLFNDKPRGIEMSDFSETEHRFVLWVEQALLLGHDLFVGGSSDFWSPEKGIVLEYKSIPKKAAYHKNYLMQTNAYMAILGAEIGYLVYEDSYEEVRFSLGLFDEFLARCRDYNHNKYLDGNPAVVIQNEGVVSSFLTTKEYNAKRRRGEKLDPVESKILGIKTKKNKVYIDEIFRKEGYGYIIIIRNKKGDLVRLKPERKTVNGEITYKIIVKVIKNDKEDDSYPV